MKTAVSIPDDIFIEAERLTQRLKTSRSQLYADALRAYLARHDSDAVTDALNQAYEQDDSRPDSALAGAMRQLLQRVESGAVSPRLMGADQSCQVADDAIR